MAINYYQIKLHKLNERFDKYVVFTAPPTINNLPATGGEASSVVWLQLDFKPKTQTKVIGFDNMYHGCTSKKSIFIAL